MRVMIINLILWIFIGGVLQIILFGTSPRLPCSEFNTQLGLIGKTIIVEYLFLILGLQLINRYLIKMEYKSKRNIWSLIIFSSIYILLFLYLVTKYYSKCIPE